MSEKTMYIPQFVLSHIQLSATPWTVAHQAPLSTGFSRREYWNLLGDQGDPPGDFPDPGIEPASPTLADGFFTAEPPEMIIITLKIKNRKKDP